ncbi:MAG: hypothetical protein J0I13_06515, partial [Rhizobiales bacterium]|nr:hypothetical protein [Hyphomicrobiales bacterium]
MPAPRPCFPGCAFVALTAAMLLLATSSGGAQQAAAAPTGDEARCTGQVAASPEAQAAACTALIDSGRYNAQNRAILYSNRGIA